eukprot:5060620-Prymnesium_polylepis.1
MPCRQHLAPQPTPQPAELLWEDIQQDDNITPAASPTCPTMTMTSRSPRSFTATTTTTTTTTSTTTMTT